MGDWRLHPFPVVFPALNSEFQYRQEQGKDQARKENPTFWISFAGSSSLSPTPSENSTLEDKLDMWLPRRDLSWGYGLVLRLFQAGWKSAMLCPFDCLVPVGALRSYWAGLSSHQQPRESCASSPGVSPWESQIRLDWLSDVLVLWSSLSCLWSCPL